MIAYTNQPCYVKLSDATIGYYYYTSSRNWKKSEPKNYGGTLTGIESTSKDLILLFDLLSGRPCPSPYWYMHWAILAMFIATPMKALGNVESMTRHLFIFCHALSIRVLKCLRAFSSETPVSCMQHVIEFVVSPHSISSCIAENNKHIIVTSIDKSNNWINWQEKCFVKCEPIF